MRDRVAADVDEEDGGGGVEEDLRAEVEEFGKFGVASAKEGDGWHFFFFFFVYFGWW